MLSNNTHITPLILILVMSDFSYILCIFSALKNGEDVRVL